MLLTTIVLDASMTVSAVLARFARWGVWEDPQQPEAQAWIKECAGRLERPHEQLAEYLAHDPESFGVAIRRQLDTNILWYQRGTKEVLLACLSRPPECTLLDALGLHEPDSNLPYVVSATHPLSDSMEGVVLDGDAGVAVSSLAREKQTGQDDHDDRSASHASAGRDSIGGGKLMAHIPDFDLDESSLDEDGGWRGGSPASAAKVPLVKAEVWPRLEAPPYMPASHPFEVTVGLAADRQAGVFGGQVTLQAPANQPLIELTIELIACGLDAPSGWTRSLKVDVRKPTMAEVTFTLVGREPDGPGPLLTMLEVRYVRGGMVCGVAARPLAIGRASEPVMSAPSVFGTPWLAQAASTSSFKVDADAPVADLTIEIAKPDRDQAGGHFICRLSSPHQIAIDAGPHEMFLGEDAKTFAREIVVQIRAVAGDGLTSNMVKAIGDRVAEVLPVAAFDALWRVAQKLKPAVPSVLIVSAEPYVPWELATIDPPLDPQRPPCLGAQALVGRWVRSRAGMPRAPDLPVRVVKPPVQPPSLIKVAHMAVMAGMYKAESGLTKLPNAEAEAAALVENFSAVPLAATTAALKRLLEAKIEQGFEVIGPVEAVHFAGHGDFDPSRPDSSAMFLSDGSQISSLLFESANYGGKQQPLIFMNACMLGIGGEMLGALAGFPGNCLAGGFGGVIGALWEVDDKLASQIGVEFWQRALPPDGGRGEPVAAILRDIRARFATNKTLVPQATFLSYVFYGHPLLTLERMS